jgi:Bacterial Ig-like domain (group 3)
VTTTSTTALAVSPQPAITNQTETMVASVTSGDGSVSPSGTLAFLNGGNPIGGCDPVPVSPTGQTVTITCQTTFGASVEQLSAVFTPTPGSAVAGSTSAVDALSVGRDSTVTRLFVPNPVTAGEPTTFIVQVSPPAVRPGPLQPTGNVEFLNGGKPIKSCGAQPIGPTGAVCTITYISTGTRAITARYQGDGNFDPSASRPKPARVEARAHITSTMRWTFFVAPTYTRVLALLVQGALHTHVVVTCHGKGCPFPQRVRAVNRKVCTRRVHGRCRQTKSSGGMLNVAPAFESRRLAVGTRIGVAITRPGWIGKYYAFTIRPGRAPRIGITCLPPGATRPGKGC